MQAILLSLVGLALAAPPNVPVEIAQKIDRVSWTPEKTAELARRMPKVELHLHLDGALAPETIRALALEQGYAALKDKTTAEIAALAVVDKPRATLAEVLAAFGVVYPLLHTPGALERMSHDAALRAHRDNVRYLEARFAPALNTGAGLDEEHALLAVLKGLSRARQETGIRSGVILCLVRPFSFVSREKNAATLALALRYKGRGVVGVDLAGDEAAQPLADYRDWFRKAKAAGLKLTAHAGETPGSRDLETALELGVDRLGHATLLAESPATLERVKARGLPIEVNLTSNLRTGAVKDLKDHPARAWFDAGIPITPSTDDPGVFAIDLAHEYGVLASELRFTPKQIVEVAFQGIAASFLSDEEKRRLRTRFTAELEALLKDLAKR